MDKKFLYIGGAIILIILVIALSLSFSTEPTVTLTDISASKYNGVTYGWDGSVDNGTSCDISFTVSECSLKPTSDDYVTVKVRFYDKSGKELSNQASVWMDKVNGTNGVVKLENGSQYSNTFSNISGKTNKIVLEVLHNGKVIGNFSSNVKKITKEDPYALDWEDIIKYDTDGDNLLDYDEYYRCWADACADVASWGYGLPSDAPSYDECFNSMDSTGDGKISVRELYGM